LKMLFKVLIIIICLLVILILILNETVEMHKFGAKTEVASSVDDQAGVSRSISQQSMVIEEQIAIENRILAEAKEAKKTKITKITISVAGDFTLGRDEEFGYVNSLDYEVEQYNSDFLHFVEYIKPLFESDDLTLVNLETTFTTAIKKADKKFRFKGDPSYVQFLQEANVEAVNIANNHTYDYFAKGFEDTVKTLEEANIGYFGSDSYLGYDYKFNSEINEIRIGLLGYKGWEVNDYIKEKIEKDIQEMKQNTDLLIVSFHWGIEQNNYPNEIQIGLGHFVIDQGADLVFGHHPHVIQGIEKYQGKYIVYSLGNFLYGGHKNPTDKDTFIFQQTFYFQENGRLLAAEKFNIIPFSISSVNTRNDYKPTPLEGEDKDRLLERIATYSSVFENSPIIEK